MRPSLQQSTDLYNYETIQEWGHWGGGGYRVVLIEQLNTLWGHPIHSR
jgi:hypothetical protein